MSEHVLLGRTVGIKPRCGFGRWWWVTILKIQVTHLGVRLWVGNNGCAGSPRWVAGKDVKTRTKRDRVQIDALNANAGGTNAE